MRNILQISSIYLHKFIQKWRSRADRSKKMGGEGLMFHTSSSTVSDFEITTQSCSQKCHSSNLSILSNTSSMIFIRILVGGLHSFMSRALCHTPSGFCLGKVQWNTEVPTRRTHRFKKRILATPNGCGTWVHDPFTPRPCLPTPQLRDGGRVKNVVQAQLCNGVRM